MKYITFILLILAIGSLMATPTIYPTTSVVEDFGSTTCGACGVAVQGLNVLADTVNPFELSFSRLYTQSGSYTTPEIDARFTHYEVVGFPVVMFNGKTRIEGSGEGIAEGTVYQNAYKQYRFIGSPLKMTLGSFNQFTGAFSGSVEMISPTANIENATIFYYLMEDLVDTNITNVVRDIVSEPFSLSGAGSIQNFNTTFQIDPTWDENNLWAVAFVQLANNAILQSVNTIPKPDRFVQAALSFDTHIVGAANTQYESPVFWIYNRGVADDFTRHIEVIAAPADWYFNYCGEDGNCYPGHIEIPFNLQSGAYVGFDLNLTIGSPGMAWFNFVVSSPSMGDYKIPFVYQVEGVSSDDPIAVPAMVSIDSSYPNPFKNEISFEVNSAKAGSSALVQIFNVKGQKVQELFANNLNAGSNTISWDSSDLPNGVYFYSLNGGTQSGKILKVK